MQVGPIMQAECNARAVWKGTGDRQATHSYLWKENADWIYENQHKQSSGGRRRQLQLDIYLSPRR